MAIHTDHGLAADLSDAKVGALCIIGDALALLGVTWLGNPESTTTDTIASSVVTVAATQRISAVR
jgi:hypothetical protein